MMNAALPHDLLDTDAVVLAIVKEAGERGILTDEITRTFLELRKTFPIEPIDTFHGSAGLDSYRVKSIVVNLAIRGLLKHGIPAKISRKGEEWMTHTLESQFKDRWNVSWFWLTLTQIREKNSGKD